MPFRSYPVIGALPFTASVPRRSSVEVEGVDSAGVGAGAGAGAGAAAEAVGARTEGAETGREGEEIEHPAIASDTESAIVAAVTMRLMRSMSGTCAESTARDVRGARPTDVQIVVKGG